MTLTKQIQALPLNDIVESAGTKLKKIGDRYTGICPLHPDNDPSFVIFPDNHFKCFGCGESGDSIDLIQRLYNFDFKGALNYLGITPGPITKEMRSQIRTARFKRELKGRREKRIRDLIFTLGILIRATGKAMALLTPENFDQLCSIIEPLPWWQQCHQTLVCGDEYEKSQCLAALKDFTGISRNLLFKPDFDYRIWLRGFENGTNTNV